MYNVNDVKTAPQEANELSKKVDSDVMYLKHQTDQLYSRIKQLGKINDILRKEVNDCRRNHFTPV